MSAIQTALMMGAAAVAAGPASAARGDALSIYEIQWTTNSDGSSDHDGEVVDCAGGIVVGKFAGWRPRLILQDPGSPDGWGAIQVKDWTSGDLFDQVDLGDWVQLSNVFVEEFRGTTLLQWQAPFDPGFVIVSTGNPLPPPIPVAVAAIPAPLEYPGDEWYVGDHAAEPFESMRLYVRNVTVTAMDLGKAVDNYNLQTPELDDCWAADYMNEDVDPWGYHPFVTAGQHFCAVVGVLEQYTSLLDGWDYYQLITMHTIDLAICGDGNSDGVVSADDVPHFGACLTGPQCTTEDEGCDPPAWTLPPLELPLQDGLMMDCDYDGDVDLRDAAAFQELFVAG